MLGALIAGFWIGIRIMFWCGGALAGILIGSFLILSLWVGMQVLLGALRETKL